MKRYQAHGFGNVRVIGDGSERDLSPRFDLRRHSTTGFAWGYGGSGPAQLALAILADALRDDARALAVYQDFKFGVIAGVSRDEPLDLSEADVLAAVETLEAAAARARSEA